MRIIITTDLHFESCGPEPIRRLVAGIDREHPDLVVIGGDIGNPVHLFEECLACFLKLNCPIAVLPGNHDVWATHQHGSEALFRSVLPSRTRELGFHWLEEAPLVLEHVAVVGSMAWYDYSAKPADIDITEEELVRLKPRYALDAVRVNWPEDDKQFAAECRTRVRGQLADLERSADIHSVLVVTHVPVFEEQMERRPEDLDWSRGTAFFGHLTMGEEIRQFSKVRYVISGHTHIAQNDVIERPPHPPIATAVVGSDYTRPRWATVDID